MSLDVCGTVMQSGKIYHIHEVVEDMEGESVRLLGTLESRETADYLVFCDASIEVNTEFINATSLVAGRLYHMIGELVSGGLSRPGSSLTLKVRVACDAEGLHTDLFFRALELQREHQRTMLQPLPPLDSGRIPP
mmetsp:Transcript_9780/g.12773  ORF Transcript_9780/g.12773 Transcript_9780/m.12773 type:complete len:135 (-) Transcript_9780:77-481(-)